MLNKQRRDKKIVRKDIAAGKRVVCERFGIDPDLLRTDSVAAVIDICVGCGLCGEVSHATILCPSLYKAQIITNPNSRGRLAHRISRLDRLTSLFSQQGFDDPRLIKDMTRYLALWMSYEDTIRVVDLKIRGSRFLTVRKEVRASEQQLLDINEFIHPRIEEVCETLLVNIGRWLAQLHFIHHTVRRLMHKGRVIKTSSLLGFFNSICWRVGVVAAVALCAINRRMDRSKISS